MFGQNASSDNAGSNEEVVVLSPFEVSATDNQGYTAATTLAGNRLNTEVRDIGNAVTVITSQFLKDIGATDNQTLLQYTTNTEVGGFYGNFAGFGDGAHLDESGRFTNPNSNTRVRGLTSADNTREYFLTSIPWEGYNIDGVDLQRGPNSILFGQGSPAGIINTRIKQAGYKDSYEASFRVGSWGSTRATVDINKVLIKNELAIRVASVRNDQEYKQDPAYSLDKRLYAAVRWEPGFLKKGSARTIIKANVEWGDINSNNPRELPPTDHITPWFYTGTTDGHDLQGNAFAYPNLNKLTVNPQANEDDNTGTPNHGFDRPSHNGPGGTYAFWTLDGENPVPAGTAGATFVNKLLPKYQASIPSGVYTGAPNEYFQPWINGSMSNVYGNPAFNFTYNDPTQGVAVNWEPSAFHGMDTNGNIGARSTSITHYVRAASIGGYSSYANKAHLYYKDLPAWQFGIFKDKSLTDPSVFDFYNNLLDGPTKSEFQNFRAINLSLAQTFFHDQVGFEASYYNEFYKSGRSQLVFDDGLYININRVYTDGSPFGKNGQPYDDGTPNPYLGVPYITGSAGTNNINVSNREDGRLTVFGDHDFAQDGHGWFTKLLGRHIITGLLSGDRQETRNINYNRYSLDDPAYEKKTNASPTDSPTQNWTVNAPYTFIYLGDSLLGANSASGAHIPRPQVYPTLTSGQVINFDATWKPSTNPNDPTYVNPAAVWHDPYGPTTNVITTDGYFRDGSGNIVTSKVNGGAGIPFDSTQSENPQNYVGFRPYNINIVDAFASDANLKRNITGEQLGKSKVFSRAFNWQGHFWDNAVVVTWGVRKDIASAWANSIDTNAGDPNDYHRLNITDANFHLNDAPNNQLTVTSHAWTAVAHLNQLVPYLKRLPVQVSLFYNKSTDFQPAAQRVDVYGVPLAAPSGETVDKGILLESSDGKYSLKINKYETASVNASSASLGGTWFIGTSQAWAANWVNRFEFNWNGDTQANAVPEPQASDPSDGTFSEHNYAPAPGETQAQASAREQSVIKAWRAWQASVDPRFYAAWKLNPYDHVNGASATNPNGFAVPEDSRSEGYEIEFSAQPTRNWRITVNGSKTEAQRLNIGGTNLADFISKYETALHTPGPGYSGVVGGVGDLRIWWGGAGNETALQDWNGNIGSEYHQRKLQEGTNAPELRKWRWNLISNYTFDHGPLKNFNVGGSVRYESSIVIGYEPIPGATANDINFNIANPYRGPSETNIGLWVGYSRKIWHNINWNIQLNVQNVGVGNELVPITTEPDGTPATYRIRAPQSWLLTNTFYF